MTKTHAQCRIEEEKKEKPVRKKPRRYSLDNHKRKKSSENVDGIIQDPSTARRKNAS